MFFFFNDTETTEIYTLSLHDALPICPRSPRRAGRPAARASPPGRAGSRTGRRPAGPREGRASRTTPFHLRRCERAVARSRSEEHTSELQSLAYLVCRLLLEKKKIIML